MFDRLPTRQHRPLQTAASLMLHALALFALTRSIHHAAVHVLMPGTMKGTRIDLVYNPGRAPVPTLHSDRKQRPTEASAPLVKSAPEVAPLPPDTSALAELPRPHLPPLRQSSPALNSQPSPAPDADAGSDSFGSGDVQIALTTYSPSPRPDLSSLPHGSQGDVILNVTIDPTGKVADLEIVRSLGHGIEDVVMATVRTWKYQPATRDGVAVASVQELHFHYGPV